MGYSTFKTEQDGGVIVIKYDNPPVNFITVRFLYEFLHLFSRLEKDDSVKVIVLTSEHPEYFINHTDTNELSEMISRVPHLSAFTVNTMVNGFGIANRIFDLFPFSRNLLLGITDEKFLVQNGLIYATRLFKAIQNSSKITVAGINGICLGGGTELTMCFDFRLMAEGQGIFLGQPEILIGMIAGYGGTQRMARVIGPARTLEIQLSGELIGARKAEALGLVYKAVPKDIFYEELMELAKKLEKRSSPAVASLKKAVAGAEKLPLDKGIIAELRQLINALRTPDTQGIIAKYRDFLNKQLELSPEQRLSPEEIMKKVEDRNF